MFSEQAQDPTGARASTSRKGPRCFLHVPKSAGTSIHVALQTALPPGALSPKRQEASMLCGFSDFELLDPSVRTLVALDGKEWRELADYAVVSGHFSLSTLLQITSPSSIATVLREPSSRLLSHYAFWRLSSSARTAWRGYSAPDHALQPLDEFLADAEVAHATDNLVCRMLLRPDPRLPEQAFIAAGDVADLASRAIAALDTLGFVDVLELGDSIWAGLSRFFEVSLTPMGLNATAAEGLAADAPDAKLKITEHTLDLLDARTAVDAIVYRYVLGAKGYSEQQAQRLTAAAFAGELVRLGDMAGASASELRERVRHKNSELQDRDELLRTTRDDLARNQTELAGVQGELASIHAELAAKQAELASIHVERAAKQAELASTQAELALQRDRLDVILSSKSWRLTAPARAAGRVLRNRRN